MSQFRRRRTVVVIIILLLLGVPIASLPANMPTLEDLLATQTGPAVPPKNVPAELSGLAVKGRAPKTGYERSLFGNGWSQTITGCDTRNAILARDLRDVTVNDDCKIMSGALSDPYTGRQILFTRGEQSSDDVQIDHVVALSNAWQTGAQQLSSQRREQFANDPLNLLAVDGPTNEQKSDSDAASWLPPNKPFRCQYVKRQIAVKTTYNLWVTPAEQVAMAQVLSNC